MCGPCGHGVIDPYFQPQSVHPAPVANSPDAGVDIDVDAVLADEREIRENRSAAGALVSVLAAVVVAWWLVALCRRWNPLAP